MGRKSRADGMGTLVQRKHGLWCARLCANGKAVYKHSRNQKECKDCLLEMQQRMGAGLNLAVGKATH